MLYPKVELIMMPGMITLWSGAIVDIPAGWTLCDGTAGTPDLRNLFVIGAGDTYNPDDTDATPTHTHDFTGDGHHHHLVAGAQIATGAVRTTQTSDDPAVGTTDPETPLPPYYALAYIMKT